jgi:hypothetical protein
MMMVGRVISVSTRPPTRGVERGTPKKLMKMARPSRPKMIDGTAARLLMLTSIISVHRFRGELLQIDGGGHADGKGEHQGDQQGRRTLGRPSDSGQFRFAGIAAAEEGAIEAQLHLAGFAQAHDPLVLAVLDPAVDLLLLHVDLALEQHVDIVIRPVPRLVWRVPISFGLSLIRFSSL